eukprot:2990349-Rhodomonas_salina.1
MIYTRTDTICVQSAQAFQLRPPLLRPQPLGAHSHGFESAKLTGASGDGSGSDSDDGRKNIPLKGHTAAPGASGRAARRNQMGTPTRAVQLVPGTRGCAFDIAAARWGRSALFWVHSLQSVVRHHHLPHIPASAS